jgi:2-polyprenyl-3-methyl-5-hydroxy-6-metoxy-1,4-benzoquinol methylase
MAYNEKEFWRKRYQTHGSSIRTVGRVDLTEEANLAQYRVAQQQLVTLLKTHVGDLQEISVLDVGFGLGHYAQAMFRAGLLDYCGIDLASTHHPESLASKGFKFYHGVDVTEPGLDLGRTFDAVVVLDVLFHIVDQARFDAAVRNIRKHARNKVFITGLFEDKLLAEHVRHRSVSAFSALGQLVCPPAAWRDNRIGVFSVPGGRR